MMRCRLNGWSMLCCSPADIPPEVFSLVDEIDVQVARFHTSTIDRILRVEKPVDILKVVQGTVSCRLVVLS